MLELFSWKPLQHLCSRHQELDHDEEKPGAVHLHLSPAWHPHVPHLHLRRDRPGQPSHWCSQF